MFIIKLTAKEITVCALFTALISIGAYIKISIFAVPFTLQTLFTMLAGLLLGAKLGSISVLVYILLGLAGVPIFTQGGGISYVLMPGFGYIIGFLAGTFVTGKIADSAGKVTITKLLSANFCGLIIIYGFGMFYYYIICNYVINQPIAVWPLFLYCFLMLIPGDIVLCIVAAYIAKRIRHVIRDMLELK